VSSHLTAVRIPRLRFYMTYVSIYSCWHTLSMKTYRILFITNGLI
jgi:hypothetical protein